MIEKFSVYFEEKGEKNSRRLVINTKQECFFTERSSYSVLFRKIDSQ